MTLDEEKIRQKLHFMREKLRELKRFQNMSIENFKSDVINEDAALRMLQVTIEAMLDICAHIASREGWGVPKTYAELVSAAARHELIPRGMEDIYKNMVAFRNRIVHLYDDVNTEEVLNIINERLDDFTPFIRSVVEKYLTGRHS